MCDAHRARAYAAPRPSCHAVLFDEDGRVLLIERRRPPHAKRWALPGGRVEAGETVAAALVREVREETGLTIRAGPLLRHFDAIERGPAGQVRRHYVVLFFRGFVESGRLRSGSDAGQVAWVAGDQLAAYDLLPPAEEVIAAARLVEGR